MSGTLKDVSVQLGTRLRNFKKAYAEEMLRRVEDKTPVRSGNLKDGWGTTMRQESFDVYNVEEYAGYVEYGTPEQRPQRMLGRTLAEGQEITDIAATKVGLK